MLCELYVLGALTLLRHTSPHPPGPTPSLFCKVGGGTLQDKCVGNLQVCLNTHYSSLGRALGRSAAARLSRAIRRKAEREVGWVGGGCRVFEGCVGGVGRVKEKRQQTFCKVVSVELNWFSCDSASCDKSVKMCLDNVTC